MDWRSALIISVFSITGCISSPVRSRPAPLRNATVQKPAAKFGELVTKPGEFVAKNPAPPAPTESLFPVKRDEPAPQQINTLLTPAPVADPPLVQAVRDYLAGRTDRAVEKLQTLEPANQQVILTMLPALAHASRADLRSAGDAAMLSGQLDSAADAAAKLCPLKIKKACFAWRVSQFGVYDPVPEKHPFLPGGCGVLYLELQNAPSQPAELPAGGKGFVTRLRGSTAWLDADGQSLAAAKPLEHTEYTRSPVRDYFLKIEFDVPSQPGTYTLVVELQDPATKRPVRQAVELKVGS